VVVGCERRRAGRRTSADAGDVDGVRAPSCLAERAARFAERAPATSGAVALDPAPAQLAPRELGHLRDLLEVVEGRESAAQCIVGVANEIQHGVQLWRFEHVPLHRVR